jgi:hypothetical protein
MKGGHDLGGVMNYAARDEWNPHLTDVLGEHFGTAMLEFDVEFEDIGDILGEHWAATLFGCAFEDMLTRTIAPGDRNLADDYLKRRGWAEKGPTKIYIRTLKTSVMSLYEVSNVVPGKSLLARDLVRGGEPVLVSERSATQSLRQWDRIAARIVPHGSKHLLSGTVLPFAVDVSEALLATLNQAAGKRAKAKLAIDDATLRGLAPLFTTAWLLDVLPKAMGEMQPTLHNSDGELVMFHRVRFPFSSSITQKDIAARLEAASELQKENTRFWNWLGELPPKRPLKGKPENAVAWSVTMDDGRTVLGNIELKGRSLILSVNSASRADRGTALIQAALDDLVGVPLTEIETVDQMRANHDPDAPRLPSLPLAEATALVHAMLDKSYRATLDEPVSMLGDLTPRSAARTAAGRRRLVTWLKFLENRSADKTDPADPMATYDFAWLWRELGVENLRI